MNVTAPSGVTQSLSLLEGVSCCSYLQNCFPVMNFYHDTATLMLLVTEITCCVFLYEKMLVSKFYFQTLTSNHVISIIFPQLPLGEHRTH